MFSILLRSHFFSAFPQGLLSVLGIDDMNRRNFYPFLEELALVFVHTGIYVKPLGGFGINDVIPPIQFCRYRFTLIGNLSISSIRYFRFVCWRSDTSTSRRNLPFFFARRIALAILPFQ